MPLAPPAGDAPAHPREGRRHGGPPGRAGRDRRKLLLSAGLVAAAALLVGVALVSLRVGSLPLAGGTVVDAMVAFDGSREHLVVRTLRLPRTIVGICIGAGLAVAGVGLQAVTRNPLASPEILGINAGASFAVVVAVHVLGVVTPALYVRFAFAGALGATALVVSLASAGRGGPTPVRLALAGAVVSALLASWVSAVLVLDRRTLDEVRFWLAGSLVGRDLQVLAVVGPFLAVGLAALLLMAVSSTRSPSAKSPPGASGSAPGSSGPGPSAPRCWWRGPPSRRPAPSRSSAWPCRTSSEPWWGLGTAGSSHTACFSVPCSS